MLPGHPFYTATPGTDAPDPALNTDMTISHDPTQAREAARHTDGRFGEQHLPEPDGLTLGDSAVSDRTTVPEPMVVVSRDTPFRVVYVPRGSSYGATGALIADADLVEFYDARHDHTVHGQFVSRYHVATIREHGRQGLDLDTGVKAWRVNKHAMGQVVDWLPPVPSRLPVDSPFRGCRTTPELHAVFDRELAARGLRWSDDEPGCETNQQINRLVAQLWARNDELQERG